jgi:polyphosphate kinase 2 (PPK2 family)
VKVHHFVLHVEREELIRRITEDREEAGARQWRLDHLDRYEQALPWLAATATVVDTTALTPADVTARILSSL